MPVPHASNAGSSPAGITTSGVAQSVRALAFEARCCRFDSDRRSSVRAKHHVSVGEVAALQLVLIWLGGIQRRAKTHLPSLAASSAASAARSVARWSRRESTEAHRRYAGCAMRPSSPTARGRALAERWRLVQEAERDELRRTPIEVKAAQLAALMASARALGWDEALSREDEIVWERWQRLRDKYRG
jgi:hypothetical protein